jgi:hypothetical protein
MTITFKPESAFTEIEFDFDVDNIIVKGETEYLEGKYSDNLYITFEDKNDKDNYISISLNKNQALYLGNFIMAFVNEKKTKA